MNQSMNPRAWPGLALIGALSLLGLLLSGTAHADPKKLCVPPANGVPGRPGPPEWLSGSAINTKIDDPRWVGATSQAYPQVGSSAQSQVRALVQGNVLYLSFQVFVDAAGTSASQQDSVYLALAQNATSAAKLIRIKVITATDGEAQGAAAYTAEYYKAGTATGAWATAIPDAGYAAMTQDLAVWRSGGGSNWAVNLKVNLADAALAISSPFKLWAGTLVQEVTTPAMFVTYPWPLGTVGAVAASGTTPPPATPGAISAGDWGDISLGAAGCSTGVSLAWNQVGTKSGSSLTNTVSTISNNTFAAWPTYSGVSTAAGKLKARFQIANWGSALEWTDIFTDVPSNAAGLIEQECQQGAGSLPSCPTLTAAQPRHQCMLVTLSSGSAVTFLNNSVYRNMDFVDSSYFERDAEINIKGLTPLPGSKGMRDVYLYLKATNMPREARGPLDEKKLAAALAEASTPLRSLKEQQRVITSSRTPHEALLSVWPTYEVHVFYDTGEKREIDKKNLMARLQPGLPFGYYVAHHGDLDGWLHDMVGLNAKLVEIAPHFFKVSVPDGGSIKLTTRLEALEPGKKPILGGGPPVNPPLDCTGCPKPGGGVHPVPPIEKNGHCTCTLPGGQGASRHGLWLTGVALGVLFMRRRRNPSRS
jgi:hypothetical protein